MKKTVTINISGIIFHIDEDAYDRLSRYMSRLKRHFAKMEGREEIISDIESRIAELLQEKIADNKQVISILDIEEVIALMGEPSEMEVGEEYDDHTENVYTQQGPKRLYRDPDNQKLAGVASGMAAYFNVNDPLWIRLLFIVGIFVYGIGPIAYIVLWILTPKAITTAEKLEMRGEPVNISNIERSFRDEYDNVKDKFNEFADGAKETIKHSTTGSRRTLDKILESIGSIILVFLKIFVAMAGVMLVFTGLGILSAAIIIPTGLSSFSFLDNNELITFSMSTFLDMIFPNMLMAILAIIALILFFGIPLIMTIYLGIWLITLVMGKSIKIPYLGIAAFSMWLTGLILVIIIGVSTGMQFRHSAIVEENQELNIDSGEILYIEALPDAQAPGWNSQGVVEIFDGEWNVKFKDDDYMLFSIPYFSQPKLSIADEISLEISSFAKGFSRPEAHRRANALVYPTATTDSSIQIATYYLFPPNEKIRDQNVSLDLNLPLGQIVHFNDNLRMFLNDNPNYFYRRNGFEGNTWIMTETGLKPYGETNVKDESRLILPEEFSEIQTITHSLGIIHIPLIGL